MLGKPKRTSRGFQYIPFFDHSGQECSLQQSSLAMYEPPGTSAIWLGVDENKPSNRMHLTLDMVKDLVSVLQNWIDTGYFDQASPSGLTSVPVDGCADQVAPNSSVERGAAATEHHR